MADSEATAAAGECPTDCFVAGTGVVTAEAADGTFSTTPIEDIKVGDQVLMRNQNDPSAPLEFEPVTAVFSHTVYGLDHVTVMSADGSSQTLQATSEHPFYVEGKGWIEAGSLVAGEKVLEDNGQEGTVTSVAGEAEPQGVTVYNFEVDGDHTYFVADATGPADDAVWVHNTTPCQVAADELRKDMEAVGEVFAPGDNAAHVVPSNLKPVDPLVLQSVNDARAVLNKYKLLNSAYNGFKTSIRGHLGTHRNVFLKVLGPRLVAADAAGGPYGVIQALTEIKLTFGLL